MSKTDVVPLYNPKGNSREKAAAAVQFVETEPPDHLRSFVHRYLELKTDGTLTDDYRFHALPDACTYVVFDQLNPVVAGTTRLRASSEELNLGKHFHYINIRFLPGVWQSEGAPVSYAMVDQEYTGELPFIETNRVLHAEGFASSQAVLSELVEELVRRELLVANPITEKIFGRLDDINSVAEMAQVAALSPRQLQRTLKRTTGFSPHDFLKVLRLQQALKGDASLSYADQSHFIHSFRKATGYTPGKYAKKFDV